VADVISLNDKLQISENQKAKIAKKRKILTVQKIFQCAKCSFKCEKCGRQIEKENSAALAESERKRIPYRFCDSCLEEYIDYINKLKGQGNKDLYWHNEAWINLWGKWVDYQYSVDQYLKSKEFIQIVRELEKPD